MSRMQRTAMASSFGFFLLCNITAPVAAQPTAGRLATAGPARRATSHNMGRSFRGRDSTSTTQAATRSGDDLTAIGDLLEHAELTVSGDFLNKVGGQTIRETTPVSHRIRGLPVSGRARIRGATYIALSPARDRGVFDIEFRGTAHGATVTHSHPVHIHSRSLSKITIRKRFYLTDAGVSSDPAQGTVTMDSQIVGVSTDLPGLRGRLARRIAWRRAHATKPQFDALSMERTRRNSVAQFEKRAVRLSAAIAELWESDELRGPGAMGRRFALSSTSKHLHLTLVPRDNQSGQVAVAGRRQPASGDAIVLRLALEELDVDSAMGLVRTISEAGSDGSPTMFALGANRNNRGTDAQSNPFPPLGASLSLDDTSLTLTIKDFSETDPFPSIAQRATETLRR